MVLASVSGLVAWYGGVAAEVHERFKPALVLLFLSHALGALNLQLVKKYGLLLRMKNPQD